MARATNRGNQNHQDAKDAKGSAMLLQSSTAHESAKGVPSREGHAPSGAGVGCGYGNDTHPGAAVKASQALTPSEGGDFHCSLVSAPRSMKIFPLAKGAARTDDDSDSGRAAPLIA